jgi:hypothetical protein
MNSQEVPHVNFSDVPMKVKLIGPLGTSIGVETVTVRGKWKQDDAERGGSFYFAVTAINGKDVKTSVKIPWTRIEPWAARGGFDAVATTERKWKSTSSNGPLGSRLPKAYDGDEWEMMGGR